MKIYYLRTLEYDSFFAAAEQLKKFIKIKKYSKNEKKQLKVFRLDAEDITNQFYGKKE